MTMRLTRRGRIVLGAAAGLLAIAVGAATASVTNRIDSLASDGTADGTADGALPNPSDLPTDSDSAIPSAAPSSDTRQPRGTTAWQVPASRQARAGEIAGFAQPFVLPGQPIQLRVSTKSERYDVVAYRIGHYGGKGAFKVGVWGPLRGRQGAPARTDPDTGAITAKWPISTELDTQAWRPGLHLLALTTRGKVQRTYTVPIVVASPSARGQLLLVASDTTWQAHNTWGGRGLFSGPDDTFADRSRAVSFARPYSWSGYRWPAAFDIPLIRHAEKQGIALAYGSVTSISANPKSVSGASGIVSSGHDGYWTAQYRDALVKARDMGTNLAFMGANAGYWQTWISQDGWTAKMVDDADMRRWRDDPDAVAENALTGQLYDCFPTRADMVIRDPRFFLFSGTGVGKGTRIGNLLGAATDRIYPLESTPRPIQIPALSSLKCNGSGSWSTMSYYTTASGAGVFSTGTMDWVRAMGGPRSHQRLGNDALRFTKKVTENLLAAMSAGPMGKSHPAVDQLDEVDLPRDSTTSVTVADRAIP